MYPSIYLTLSLSLLSRHRWNPVTQLLASTPSSLLATLNKNTGQSASRIVWRSANQSLRRDSRDLFNTAIWQVEHASQSKVRGRIYSTGWEERRHQTWRCQFIRSTEEADSPPDRPAQISLNNGSGQAEAGVNLLPDQFSKQLINFFPYLAHCVAKCSTAQPNIATTSRRQDKF